MKATIDENGELKEVYICEEHNYRGTFHECRDCIEEHHLEEAGVGLL